ncbi:MAG TPA: hypothetical protein DHU56_01495 [Marinobacter sp.]|nr:hypothetical protein [Marinobacter sp.]
MTDVRAPAVAHQRQPGKVAGRQQRHFRILLPLLVLGGVSAITIGVTKSFVPIRAVELGANEVQLGLVAATLPLGMLIMALPAGILLQRRSATTVFSWGALGAALIYGTIAYRDSLWSFGILLTCLSCMFPLRFVTVQRRFLTLLPVLGPASAGWLRATQMMGAFVIGPLFAGAFLHVGTPVGLMLSVSVALLATIAFAIITRTLETPTAGGADHSLGTPPGQEKKDLVSRLRMAYLMEGLAQGVIQLVNTFAVLIAIQKLSLTAEQGATLIALHGLGFVACLIFGGQALKRLPPVLLRSCSLVTALAALVAMPLMSSLMPAGAVAVALGAALGLMNLQNMQIFAEAASDQIRASQVAARSVICGPSGALVGGIGAGAIARVSDLTTVFHIAAAIMAALLLWQLSQPFRLLSRGG